MHACVCVCVGGCWIEKREEQGMRNMDNTVKGSCDSKNMFDAEANANESRVCKQQLWATASCLGVMGISPGPQFSIFTSKYS